MQRSRDMLGLIGFQCDHGRAPNFTPGGEWHHGMYDGDSASVLVLSVPASSLYAAYNLAQLRAYVDGRDGLLGFRSLPRQLCDGRIAVVTQPHLGTMHDLAAGLRSKPLTTPDGRGLSTYGGQVLAQLDGHVHRALVALRLLSANISPFTIVVTELAPLELRLMVDPWAQVLPDTTAGAPVSPVSLDLATRPGIAPAFHTFAPELAPGVGELSRSHADDVGFASLSSQLALTIAFIFVGDTRAISGASSLGSLRPAPLAHYLQQRLAAHPSCRPDYGTSAAHFALWRATPAKVSDFIKAVGKVVEMQRDATGRPFSSPLGQALDTLPMSQLLQGAKSPEDVPGGHVLTPALRYQQPALAERLADHQFHGPRNMKGDPCTWTPRVVVMGLKNILKHQQSKVAWQSFQDFYGLTLQATEEEVARAIFDKSLPDLPFKLWELIADDRDLMHPDLGP